MPPDQLQARMDAVERLTRLFKLERLVHLAVASLSLVMLLLSAGVLLYKGVIRGAVDEDDFALFHELVTVRPNLFEAQPDFAQYAKPTAEDERVLRTFWGM